MDFSWSKEQRALYDDIVAFARAELAPGHLERERHARFDPDLWDKAAARGLAGLPVPLEWGGAGLTVLETILSIEALGYGCADSGLVFSLCAHTLACAVPIWRAGSDEQRSQFLRPLARGRWIGANAITEPDAGSDVFALTTTAERQGDGYVLNGSKRFITNGPVADVFLVYATIAPASRFLGVTPFLVPRDTPGLEISPNRDKVGLRSCPMAEIRLRDCAVPGANRLGEEGAGGMVFTESMRWERTCLFAAWVGSMQRQLEDCVAYARRRTQFGQAIGKFQSVANRMVEMKRRLEASRWLLYRAGWLFEQGEPCDLEIALSKLQITESAVLSGLDAIQVFGGNGCLSDMGVDVALRDAILARIYSGTSEVQRTIVANGLGL